jgi:hypothetical protein
MFKFLAVVVLLSSFSTLANDTNTSAVYKTKIDSVAQRLSAYQSSTIVKENISDLEIQYSVTCSPGEVSTGIMDNPLINRTIYKATCDGVNPIQVRIISKMKMLRGENKGFALFKLRHIRVKNMQ